MNIIYYDQTMPKETVYKVSKHLQKQLGPDTIVVPKSFDILLECSEEQLLGVRELIDKALEKKKESC